MQTVTDNRELIALDRECYPANPLSFRQWNRVLTAESEWCVVSLCARVGAEKGRRVAYLVSEVVGGVIWVKRLGVAVESRRRGLASGLLATLSGWDCGARVREDNIGGLKLLTGCGFRVEGVERGRWGEFDGVRLVRGKSP